MGRTIGWGGALAVASALGVVACGDRPDGPGSAGPTPGPTATAASTAPTPSSSAPRPTLPAGSRPPLRDDGAPGPAVDGLVLELRSLRGRVASVDGIGLALRVRAAVPPGATPRSGESVDWSRVLSTLRVEVKDPAGVTHVLEPSERPADRSATWPLDDLVQTLTVDGAGVAQGAARRPWRAPAAGLLRAPGTHAVTIAATLDTGRRKLELRSGTVQVEVAPATPDALALVDLERAASTIARATWGLAGIPAPSHPTVEDTSGAVSVRFVGADRGEGGTGYDVDVLEVWLDRAGKTLGVDAYGHFQCVAEGTRVETPGGPVPIEVLVVGDEVRSFDVATGTPSVSRVLRIARGHAETLHVVGDLRVTPEHPVWSDGAWSSAGAMAPRSTLLGVDLRPVVVTSVVTHAPSVVFDVTVSEPSTYFAGGVLVHNKAAHVPLGGDRPWGPLFFRRAAAAAAP